MLSAVSTAVSEVPTMPWKLTSCPVRYRLLILVRGERVVSSGVSTDGCNP